MFSFYVLIQGWVRFRTFRRARAFARSRLRLYLPLLMRVMTELQLYLSFELTLDADYTLVSTRKVE